MIALTDEPLPCWNTEKEWKFRCKYWIKKLINCCFSQNMRKHELTSYLMYLCYFFSYLYKYRNRCWANQQDTFIIISTKKVTFIATHLIWHSTFSNISHPPLSKNMKGPMQIKRSKCYSLMLLSLKINCRNIRTK